MSPNYCPLSVSFSTQFNYVAFRPWSNTTALYVGSVGSSLAGLGLRQAQESVENILINKYAFEDQCIQVHLSNILPALSPSLFPISSLWVEAPLSLPDNA